MANVRIKDLTTTAATTASDDFFGVDGATNGTRKLNAFSPTFGGNLTVSGTGTSSFAGKIQTTSANGIEAIVGSGNTGLSLQSGSTQYSLYLNAADNSYRLYSSLGGDRFAVSSGGNFLVGGTIDSSNGNLQLKDTSGSSTKGIGFGTDVGLYRPQAGVLAIDGSQAALYLRDSGTTKGRFNVTGSTLYIDGVDASGSTGQIILRTGNGGGTALTLDSSQNAIFAGSTGVQLKNDSFLYFGSTVRTAVKGNSTGSLELYANNNLSLTLDSSANATFAGATVNVSKAGNNPSFKATDGAVITKLQSQTAGDTTGAIGTESNHTLKLITNNTTRLTIAATGDATFTGAIAIGNTVNTVSPTSPNRTITMVIGGTTYYIHAKTTND